MTGIERRVAQELKAMTRREVLVKAIEGRITWIQAAEIMGISPRHLRRLREEWEVHGFDALRDHRHGRMVRKRLPAETIAELCRLRRERYRDFSIRHFYEIATEQHGLKLSYTWTRVLLQTAGLAEKAPGRGKYRRKRERRPMVGMLVHLDGSRHAWIPELPMQDLIVALDDADGRILFARFVPEEGTISTFQALFHVLTHFGRFCELYTDRGSHFCYTRVAGEPPEEDVTQLQRVLRVLGIRQILAHSPQARGRSERAFGTIQGRLPQELRVAGIRSYDAANEYLDQKFVPAFNRRFTVKPAQPEKAFTPIPCLDLALVLSVQYERVVQNDGTVRRKGLVLQLPRTPDRISYARCTVVLHYVTDGTVGVSYQGRLLARYKEDGTEIRNKKAA